MIKRYTFLKHPFYFVLENSREMVAGLDKCVAVFYNQAINKVEAITSNGALSVLNCEDEQLLMGLRKSKIKTNWIKADQVPFELNEGKMEQLSFLDEEESSVLELRFRNEADGNYDVLYFYFKNNIGNFKLSTVDEAMAVTIKEVIQSLLYKQVSLMVASNTNNASIHQKLSKTFTDSSLQEKINNLELGRFEAAKSNYTYLLGKLTLNESVEFVLSSGAVRKLMSMGSSLDVVDSVLLASLELILNKYNPSGFYEIKTHDLIIADLRSNPTVSVKQENLNKTEQFMDRYEAAAKLLIAKNMKLTGFNLGENCYPKVSPAAISDVLKKHQKKIVVLFQQYPERWSLIRSKFKPVMNITERYAAVTQSQLRA